MGVCGCLHALAAKGGCVTQKAKITDNVAVTLGSGNSVFGIIIRMRLTPAPLERLGEILSSQRLLSGPFEKRLYAAIW